MGICWNCEKDVTLKEEEIRCDGCKEIVRYWCNSCKQPFDVEDKDNKKKLEECKWCGFFRCPHCRSCGPKCSKYEHLNEIKKVLDKLLRIDLLGKVDKQYMKIISYFEDIKSGKEKTSCEFGVPKTYAKERIKSYFARIEGFRVKSPIDQKRFKERREEILVSPIGTVFTIKQKREAGTYGQEYRDVFNLLICLGKLEHEKKDILENGKKIGQYDSWIRVQGDVRCPHLDTDNLVVRYCLNCKGSFPRSVEYCDKCFYKKDSKKHNKGEPYKLKDKLSNNPTCKNLANFKREWETK